MSSPPTGNGVGAGLDRHRPASLMLPLSSPMSTKPIPLSPSPSPSVAQPPATTTTPPVATMDDAAFSGTITYTYRRSSRECDGAGVDLMRAPASAPASASAVPPPAAGLLGAPLTRDDDIPSTEVAYFYNTRYDTSPHQRAMGAGGSGSLHASSSNSPNAAAASAAAAAGASSPARPAINGALLLSPGNSGSVSARRSSYLTSPLGTSIAMVPEDESVDGEEDNDAEADAHTADPGGAAKQQQQQQSPSQQQQQQQQQRRTPPLRSGRRTQPPSRNSPPTGAPLQFTFSAAAASHSDASSHPAVGTPSALFFPSHSFSLDGSSMSLAGCASPAPVSPDATAARIRSSPPVLKRPNTMSHATLSARSSYSDLGMLSRSAAGELVMAPRSPPMHPSHDHLHVSDGINSADLSPRTPRSARAASRDTPSSPDLSPATEAAMQHHRHVSFPNLSPAQMRNSRSNSRRSHGDSISHTLTAGMHAAVSNSQWAAGPGKRRRYGGSLSIMTDSARAAAAAARRQHVQRQRADSITYSSDLSMDDGSMHGDSLGSEMLSPNSAGGTGGGGGGGGGGVGLSGMRRWARLVRTRIIPFQCAERWTSKHIVHQFLSHTYGSFDVSSMLAQNFGLEEFRQRISARLHHLDSSQAVAETSEIMVDMFRSLKTFHRLLDGTSVLNAHLSKRQALQNIISTVHALIDAEKITVFLLHKKGDALTLKAVSAVVRPGGETVLQPAHETVASELVSIVARTGELRNIRDCATEPLCWIGANQAAGGKDSNGPISSSSAAAATSSSTIPAGPASGPPSSTAAAAAAASLFAVSHTPFSPEISSATPPTPATHTGSSVSADMSQTAPTQLRASPKQQVLSQGGWVPAAGGSPAPVHSAAFSPQPQQDGATATSTLTGEVPDSTATTASVTSDIAPASKLVYFDESAPVTINVSSPAKSGTTLPETPAAAAGLSSPSRSPPRQLTIPRLSTLPLASPPHSTLSKDSSSSAMSSHTPASFAAPFLTPQAPSSGSSGIHHQFPAAPLSSRSNNDGGTLASPLGGGPSTGSSSSIGVGRQHGWDRAGSLNSSLSKSEPFKLRNCLCVPVRGSNAGKDALGSSSAAAAAAGGAPGGSPSTTSSSRLRDRGTDASASQAASAAAAVASANSSDKGSGKVVAVIQVCNKKTGAHFSNEDVQILQFVGLLAGQSLSNASLYEEALVRRRQQEALCTMIELMSAETGVDQVITHIIDAAYRLLEVDRISLYMVDEVRGQLLCKVSKDPNDIGQRLPLKWGIIGRVAAEGVSINITDAETDPEFDKTLDKVTGYTTRNILTLPIQDAANRVAAVIQVINKKKGVFTREDEVLLTSLSRSAGQILRKAQLFSALLVEQRKTKALMAILQAEEREVSIEALMDRILQTTHDVLPCQKVALCFVDAVREDFYALVADPPLVNAVTAATEATTAGAAQASSTTTSGGSSGSSRHTVTVNLSSALSSPPSHVTTGVGRGVLSSTRAQHEAPTEPGNPPASVVPLPLPSPPSTAVGSPAASASTTSAPPSSSTKHKRGGTKASFPALVSTTKHLSLPLHKGLTGWVAENGQSVNLANAPADPRFDPLFDKTVTAAAVAGGEPKKSAVFKTRSTLVVPLLNSTGSTIAVLQAINRLRQPEGHHQSHASGHASSASSSSSSSSHGSHGSHGSDSLIVPFSEEDEDIFRALCIQAGITLRRRLTEVLLGRSRRELGDDKQINSLFEIYGGNYLSGGGGHGSAPEGPSAHPKTPHYYHTMQHGLTSHTHSFVRGLSGEVPGGVSPSNARRNQQQQQRRKTLSEATTRKTQGNHIISMHPIMGSPLASPSGTAAAAGAASSSSHANQMGSPLNRQPRAGSVGGASLPTIPSSPSPAALPASTGVSQSLERTRSRSPTFRAGVDAVAASPKHSFAPTPGGAGAGGGVPGISPPGSRRSSSKRSSGEHGATLAVPFARFNHGSAPAPALTSISAVPVAPMATRRATLDTPESDGGASDASIPSVEPVVHPPKLAWPTVSPSSSVPDPSSVPPPPAAAQPMLGFVAHNDELRLIRRKWPGYGPIMGVSGTGSAGASGHGSAADAESAAEDESFPGLPKAKSAPGLGAVSVSIMPATAAGGPSARPRYIWPLLPSVALSGLDIAALQDINTFNVFDYSEDQLVHCSLLLLQDLNLLAEFGLSLPKLQSFLCAVRHHYNNNPYHNYYHGFGVMHFAYWMLRSTDACLFLPKPEQLALLLAALCHDIDHPGNTNGFQIACQSDVARAHNDQAVLEHHHAFVTFELLRDPNMNVLTPEEFTSPRGAVMGATTLTNATSSVSPDAATPGSTTSSVDSAFPDSSSTPLGSPSPSPSLSPASGSGSGAGSASSSGGKWTLCHFRSFRKTVISAILATDMSRHFEMLRKLDGLEPDCLSLDASKEEDRQFMVDLLTHSADLSAQVLPYPLAVQWEARITQEFMCQASMEEQLGLPVSSFMQGLNDEAVRYKNHVNFLDYIASPLWMGVAELLPQLAGCVQNLLHNRKLFMRFLPHEDPPAGAGMSKLAESVDTSPRGSEPTSPSGSEGGPLPASARIDRCSSASLPSRTINVGLLRSSRGYHGQGQNSPPLRSSSRSSRSHSLSSNDSSEGGRESLHMRMPLKPVQTSCPHPRNQSLEGPCMMCALDQQQELLSAELRSDMLTPLVRGVSGGRSGMHTPPLATIGHRRKLSAPFVLSATMAGMASGVGPSSSTAATPVTQAAPQPEVTVPPPAPFSMPPVALLHTHSLPHGHGHGHSSLPATHRSLSSPHMRHTRGDPNHPLHYAQRNRPHSERSSGVFGGGVNPQIMHARWASGPSASASAAGASGSGSVGSGSMSHTIPVGISGSFAPLFGVSAVSPPASSTVPASGGASASASVSVASSSSSSSSSATACPSPHPTPGGDSHAGTPRTPSLSIAERKAQRWSAVEPQPGARP